MFTRSIATETGLDVPTRSWTPTAIARSARDLAGRDLPSLVRRADVAHRVETEMDVAADAIRSAVEQIPGRRRRNPWRPWLPALAIVGALVVIAITGAWLARGSASSAAREGELDDRDLDLDRDLDEDAQARATDEGMPTAGATDRTFIGTPVGPAADLGALANDAAVRANDAAARANDAATRGAATRG